MARALQITVNILCLFFVFAYKSWEFHAVKVTLFLCVERIIKTQEGLERVGEGGRGRYVYAMVQTVTQNEKDDSTVLPGWYNVHLVFTLFVVVVVVVLRTLR